MVENIPGAVVLASSDFCPHSVVKVAEHILSFQGHPEFSKDYSQAILVLRREVFGDDNTDRALASLSDPVDSLKIAQWMVDFYRA